jgi:hypothetical protein
MVKKADARGCYFWYHNFSKVFCYHDFSGFLACLNLKRIDAIYNSTFVS